MKLLPLLCLLTQGFGPTSALENRPGVVTVSEGADALLPCVLDSGHNIDKFDWKKDSGEEEKQEVLFYENGEQAVYQSEQFKGRVQIFEHELKSGNASIQIKNTRLEDNGTYTCVLFKGDKQININIRLNVGVGLKKREHITGAAPKPYIQTLEDQITWRLLECQANGVPEPDMTWENSAGEVLAKHVPKNNAQVELQLNVTRSDTYKCVVTQWSIYHQINNTEKVRLSEKETDSGAAPEPYVKHIRVEKHWALLQCKVPFAVPKPELEWRDSSGEVLSSPLSNEDKHVTSSQDASGRLHFELLVNVTRSDLYTCVVTQRSIYHQINNTLEVRLQEKETDSDLHFLAVLEGEDVILPCSSDSKENIESMVFSWIKDEREVFFYNKGHVEEDERFTGRLTHFHHEVKSGNASIKIHSTQMSDHGRYSCKGPDIQKSSYTILQIVGAARPTGWIIAVVILVIVVIFLSIIVIRKRFPKGRTQRNREQVSLNSSSSRQNDHDI